MYQTTTNIKARISYEADMFFDEDEEVKFDELLTVLEEESRALIESYKGDVTYSVQNDQVVDIEAPDGVSVPLIFPVNDVSQVRISRGNEWEVLSSDRYYHSRHRLYLRERQAGDSFRDLYRKKNPALRDAHRITWRMIATRVEITYDRGYELIPGNILGVQISIINNILRTMRGEQSIAAINPDGIPAFIDTEKVMTEGITRRLDQSTSFGGTTVVI